LEGTTAAIRRGGQLAGAGAVAVKAVARANDYRFDTPTVGVETVEAAAASGVTVVAVEAGRVLVMDREATVAAADRAGVALVPVVYFIPPQIWAWRGGRIEQIRRRVSLVLTVLPFEAAIYRRAGVPVEFVGHPIVDAIARAPSRDDARRAIGADANTLVIGLLP